MSLADLDRFEFFSSGVQTALDTESLLGLLKHSDFLNNVPVTGVVNLVSPEKVIDLTHSPAGSPVKAKSDSPCRQLF